MRELLFGESDEPITRAPESAGFYEGIPTRVGEFTLETNEEGRVVFETTSRQFCDEGPKISVVISADGGWNVRCFQGKYQWVVAPPIRISDDRIELWRVFWYAGQYMAGREPPFDERGTPNSKREAVFDEDAFFESGEPVTTNPFGEFLEE